MIEGLKESKRWSTTNRPCTGVNLPQSSSWYSPWKLCLWIRLDNIRWLSSSSGIVRHTWHTMHFRCSPLSVLMSLPHHVGVIVLNSFTLATLHICVPAVIASSLSIRVAFMFFGLNILLFYFIYCDSGKLYWPTIQQQQSQKKRKKSRCNSCRPFVPVSCMNFFAYLTSSYSQGLLLFGRTLCLLHHPVTMLCVPFQKALLCHSAVKLNMNHDFSLVQIFVHCYMSIGYCWLSSWWWYRIFS